MADKYVEISFRGGSARGRNSWFKPHEAEVGRIEAYHFKDEFSYINVYSKTRGGLAPIILEMVPGDAVRLGANLILLSGVVDNDLILKKHLESLINRVLQNSKVGT